VRAEILWYYKSDLETCVSRIPQVAQVIWIAGNHNRAVMDRSGDHDRVNGVG